MLKKVITTTALATVLLTNSISANELGTQGFSPDTAKVEAFQGIPSQGLNSSELNEQGEAWWMVGVGIVAGGVWLGKYAHQKMQSRYGNEYYKNPYR
ncbi:MAG: Unknown protein [uncultured Sulfurovum sp.]|uniref:Arginine/ornithine antiporter ArcD n=1 Tax=uncultured Sulfurovum sp. TaxID=269237 RepID=A0A6S6SX50_9BACT|nr:MAG: Unknown protein [uncultured Sulfurovum sp.]